MHSAATRKNGTNDALSSQQEAERMFDMRNAEIDQRWNSNMLDLEAEKQARIRALASQLADLKQFGA
jgi:L-rhamnose mutarotase